MTDSELVEGLHRCRELGALPMVGRHGGERDWMSWERVWGEVHFVPRHCRQINRSLRIYGLIDLD